MKSHTKSTMKFLSLGKSFVIFAFATLFLVSCADKGKGIHDLEVGQNNKGEGYLGANMPVKANIQLGDEQLESIELGMESLDGSSTFSMDLTPRYAGQNAFKLEEEFIFPSGTEAGSYVLVLDVKGNNGSVMKEQRTFNIHVDSSLPYVDELEVGLNQKGDDLHLAANIVAPKKIKRVVLIVKGAAWEKEFIYDQPRTKDQTAVHFHEHAHIDDAPAGDYNVELIVEDQEGRSASTTGTVQKK